MAKIVDSVKSRAEQLAGLLDRPVYVSRPPIESNDLNDWWVAASRNEGHTMTEQDRHAIGREMVADMIDRGEEIQQNEDDMRKFRVAALETLKSNLLCKSELDRGEAIQRGGGDLDADYDPADSCSFFKSLYRPNKKKGGADYLIGHLACKSWTCPNCRRRKLKPEWAIHAASKFSLEPIIYCKSISELQ